MQQSSSNDQAIPLSWAPSTYRFLALIGLLCHIGLLLIPPFHPQSDLGVLGPVLLPYFPFISVGVSIGINGFVTYTVFSVTHKISFNGFPLNLKQILSSHASRSIHGYLLTFLILGYITTPQHVTMFILHTLQLGVTLNIFIWLVVSPLLIIALALVIGRIYK